MGLTCTEGAEDDPVVERLSRAVVVLQQHPVWIFSFTGVKYRLHLQQLEWRGEGERDGKNSPEALNLKQNVRELTDVAVKTLHRQFKCSKS